jgi:hypothetical protein
MFSIDELEVVSLEERWCSSSRVLNRAIDTLLGGSMKTRAKLVVGSVLALVLGLAVSLPILFANFALATRVRIGVDVVYAYFGVYAFNENVTGLWRNLTVHSEPYIISYLIVLNVTNLSDQLATMNDFYVAAAPEILVQNDTEKIGSQKLAENFSASGGDFALSIQNAIMTDFLDVNRYYPAWSQYWSSHRSRLIALSGTTEVPDSAYAALTNGTIYLFGEVHGRAYGEGAYSRGFGLKQVQLQVIGREFLYNGILSENQILRIDSNKIDVRIETRR